MINMLHFSFYFFKRFNFANKIKSWLKEFQDIIYTDEKTFQSFSNGKVLVKRKRNDGDDDRYLTFSNITRRFKINVWGALVYNKKPFLYKVSENFDSKEFIKLIEDKFAKDLPNYKLNYVVWQDNAPHHVSILSQKFFYDQKIYLLRCPPSSPDLNPIENLWGMIQKELNKYLSKNQTISEDDLFKQVKRISNNISIEIINKLIDKMNKRVDATIANKGKSTKY